MLGEEDSRTTADLMTLMEMIGTSAVQVRFEQADSPGGRFDARNGVPVITILRSDRRRLVDPHGELSTLAHEYGHALSWMQGLEVVAFAENLEVFKTTGLLEETERLALLDEECRAWNRAFKVVEDLGRKRSEFIVDRDQALEGYRVGLKLHSVSVADRLQACEKGPIRETRPMCLTCCGMRWKQEISDD